MSDEKRNISDINDQQTAEQQAFSEEIRRRLAQPDSGKPTLDEFKVMVYKDREKRRKKRNALVACIVAAFIVGYLTYDDLVPEVGADKNPKETIQIEDGVIIEDGGWGSSVGDENVWVVTEWENVEDAKKQVPSLLIPEYVPEGYDFKQLKVETATKNGVVCEYVFENNNQTILEIEIFISNGEIATSIYEDYEKLKCTKGILYVERNEKTAIIPMKDGRIINIWYDVSEEMLVRLVEELR